MSNEGGSNYRWYHIDQAPHFVVSFLTLIAVVVYACYARQQVEATQNANEIARAALTEANKPFVAFDSFNPYSFTRDASGLHRHAAFVWRNFGNTPALSSTFYVCSPIIRDNESPPPYKCDLDIAPIEYGPVPAKQPLTVDGPIIPDDVLAATRDNKKSIYIIEYTSYKDSVSFDKYGNPLTRYTGHCVRVIQQKYELPPNVTLPAQVETQMESQAPVAAKGCQDFNYCVDSQCPEMPKYGDTRTK